MGFPSLDGKPNTTGKPIYRYYIPSRSTSSSRKHYDTYDVYDYDDPKDFYYDHEDEFEDYEDAEDYFDEDWDDF